MGLGLRLTQDRLLTYRKERYGLFSTREKIMRVSPAATLSVSLTIPLPLASTKARFSGVPFRFKQYLLNNQILSRPGRLVAEKPTRRWTFSCKCRNRGRNGYAKFDDEGEDFIVVNFYRFVSIGDPEAVIEKHLSFLKVRLFTECELSSCLKKRI